jgi:hypothetical protein
MQNWIRKKYKANKITLNIFGALTIISLLMLGKRAISKTETT